MSERGAASLRVIRARRYVSAPVGRYPAAVPVSGASSLEEPSGKFDEAPVDPPAEQDPFEGLFGGPSESAAAAQRSEEDSLGDFFADSGVSEKQDALSGIVDEPALSPKDSERERALDDLERALAPPTLPEEELADEDARPAGEGAEAGPAHVPRIEVSRRPGRGAARGSAGLAALAMILGAVIGAALGSAAALALLAYVNGSPWQDIWLDPMGLVSGMEDPVVLGGASLVLLGTTILGALRGRRLAR